MQCPDCHRLEHDLDYNGSVNKRIRAVLAKAKGE